MVLNDLKIIFDNSQNAFFSGQTVSGRLVVQLDSPEYLHSEYNVYLLYLINQLSWYVEDLLWKVCSYLTSQKLHTCLPQCSSNLDLQLFLRWFNAVETFTVWLVTSILTFSSHLFLCLPGDLFLWGIATKLLYKFPTTSHTLHVLPISCYMFLCLPRDLFLWGSASKLLSKSPISSYTLHVLPIFPFFH